MSVKTQTKDLLQKLGVNVAALEGGDLAVRTPTTGETIANVKTASSSEISAQIDKAMTRLKLGAKSQPHVVASWCACWAKNCAPTKMI